MSVMFRYGDEWCLGMVMSVMFRYGDECDV